MDTLDIPGNISNVRARIAAAARAAGRAPDAVTLLAVSKTKPVELVRAARAAGLRAFGENYAQEGVEKMLRLDDPELVWHFIGPIQSNKTRLIAEHYHWVHGIDRDKVARRLSEQRPSHMRPLQVCLQVNVSGEASKAGLAPDAVPALADLVAGLPGLRLRGLMAIPAPEPDPDAQRRPFARLRDLFESLKRQHGGLDTLSMGMSADLEAAIAEGATLVRVGTDIFGARGP